jgi:hypothetical protein
MKDSIEDSTSFALHGQPKPKHVSSETACGHYAGRCPQAVFDDSYTVLSQKRPRRGHVDLWAPSNNKQQLSTARGVVWLGHSQAVVARLSRQLAPRQPLPLIGGCPFKVRAVPLLQSTSQKEVPKYGTDFGPSPTFVPRRGTQKAAAVFEPGTPDMSGPRLSVRRSGPILQSALGVRVRYASQKIKAHASSRNFDFARCLEQMLKFLRFCLHRLRTESRLLQRLTSNPKTNPSKAQTKDCASKPKSVKHTRCASHFAASL